MVEKNKSTQTVIIAVLAVSILVMSVGFAASAYTQNLKLEGSSATVKASKWDVHFKEGTTNYSETTGSVAATTHTLNGTTLTYSVVLTNPGDFYEATVTAENLGTFDADLTGITMSGLTETQKNYVKYTVKVGSNEYSATNTTITGSTLAKTNGTTPVVVRVEYVQPATATLLPTEDQTINLSATLTYTQVS